MPTNEAFTGKATALTSDFSSDPQPDNPFASPPSVVGNTPVMPSGGIGMVCDGTSTDALKVGWDLLARWFWPFLGYTLLCLIIRSPADYLDEVIRPADQETAIGLWGLAQVYDFFVATPVAMGLAWVFLKAARYEHFTMNDLFGAFSRNYLNAVLAGFLKGILVMLGLLLLIVPGLILFVKFAFVEYLVVDRKMGAIEAMKASWRITDGREWTIFGLMLWSFVIFVCGLMLCGVGVIPAIMWISAGYAVLYHTYCQVDRPEVPEPTTDSTNPFSG